MKTLLQFIEVLQSLVDTLCQALPHLYPRKLIVTKRTQFVLHNSDVQEERFRGNDVSKRCLWIREMKDVSVAKAYERLYKDTEKHNKMVRGEKFTEMFLNTLGCNNNGEPYSKNRRFLCMVNCSPLTMLGDTQQCSHSNQPTKQKKQPNQLIWKPPSCPQLATRPSSHLQASEKEHDNKISGDTFAVGKKRSRNESLSVEHEDIPFKKVHQRCPTTQLNHKQSGGRAQRLSFTWS